MKKRVAVVGATGIAGQQFLVALERHPWFEVVLLAASERSAGKTYRAALHDPKSGARRWWCAEAPPAACLDLPVERADGLGLAGIDIVFAAVESDAARTLEPQYAKTTPVLSTASAFRYEDDVPIMVPGVNVATRPSSNASGARAAGRGSSLPCPTARPWAWRSPSSRCSTASGCSAWS